MVDSRAVPHNRDARTISHVRNDNEMLQRNASAIASNSRLVADRWCVSSRLKG